MSVSLDGFVATPDGSLDWVLVDEELHAAAGAIRSAAFDVAQGVSCHRRARPRNAIAIDQNLVRNIVVEL